MKTSFRNNHHLLYNFLSKCRRPVRREELLVCAFSNAMWKRKFEIFGEKLLQVRPLDIAGLLDFDNFKDLVSQIC